MGLRRRRGPAVHTQAEIQTAAEVSVKVWSGYSSIDITVAPIRTRNKYGMYCSWTWSLSGCARNHARDSRVPGDARDLERSRVQCAKVRIANPQVICDDKSYTSHSSHSDSKWKLLSCCVVLNYKMCVQFDLFCWFTCRDTVMKLMREIDPQGILMRRKRRLRRRTYISEGPNWAWHVDG